MRSRTLPLCLLALLIASSVSANTLLTNGIPVSFVLPVPPTQGTFYGGDLGYAIYVPPGASSLTIDFEPGDQLYVCDVLVRLNSDVGFTGVGTLKYDYITPSGGGSKTLVISGQSFPSLQTGTYYIGFNVVSLDVQPALTLTATITGGGVPPIRTIAASTFDNDLDGWVRNSAASSLPGASQGDPTATLQWQTSGGNPSGFVQLSRLGAATVDALVAPAKFLGNVSGLVEPRFEFDLMPIAGAGPMTAVEIRIFGSDTAFSWLGSIPPAPGINFDPCAKLVLDPATGKSSCVSSGNSWFRYTASLHEPLWSRLAGAAPFAQVLTNIQRIEVIMTLSPFGETNGMDNFALRSRGTGPPNAVLAGYTGFVAGADGWTRNYPATSLDGATAGNTNSTLRWVPFEGNPGGYVRLASSGGPNRDFAVAPDRLVGDYTGLTNPQFEFDYQHTSLKGPSKPIEVHLIGAQSVFVWTGPVPTSTWTHYTVPLTSSVWTRTSGSDTLAQALANVQRVEISMQQSTGPEANGIDNVWLLPGPINPAPPAISANPVTVAFSAQLRGANPAPQPVSVTSIGGGTELNFSIAPTANWLKVSAPGGITPRTLNVWPEIAGLAPGAYDGAVTVTAPGTGLGPQTVAVSLTVNESSGPTPHFSAGGVVNAASSRTQLAPGSLGTLYGTGLGPATGVVASFIPGTGYLPTRLAGVRLVVKETSGAFLAEAPLLYVSNTQVNFQLPFETLGRLAVWLVVDNNGVLSDPQTVQVVSNAPGIFTWGENRAVAVNQDNSVNSAASAAVRGSTLTVYLTGQGPVTPNVPTGAAAPPGPLARSPFPAQAWIGGAPAKVLFVGLTPGLVGVLQINLVVPSSAPSGDSPLVVQINSATSNTPLVTVR